MNDNLSIQIVDEHRAMQAVKALANTVLALRNQVLQENIDFGVIPGTGDKPTLLLPGMEKLMRALNAVPEYIERAVIRDYQRPLFHYEYECRLIDAETGIAIPGGRGLGLCTSAESSFAWRWVSADKVPTGMDKATLEQRNATLFEFKFTVEKAETTGKYGKPAAYWKAFQDAIQAGTARAVTKKTSTGKDMEGWEIGGVSYRIPNPDIFDQVNAILKRAKKRALGDAIKGAASVSEFFTVDVEDFARYDDVIEGTYTVVQPSTQITVEKPAEPKAQPTSPASQSPAIPAGQPGNWFSANRIKAIVDAVRFDTAQDLSDAELKTLLGIENLDDIGEWNKKYLDGDVARAAAKKAFEAKMSAEKPAAPKYGKTPVPQPAPKFEWTPDRIQAMDAFVRANYWDKELEVSMSPDKLLVMTEIPGAAWSAFADMDEAKAIIKTTAIKHGVSIIAHYAEYQGQYSELGNDQFTVRLYGRDRIRAVSDTWATYADSWQKGKSYTFADKGNLIVHWQPNKDGFPQATDIQPTDIPF